MNVFKKIRFLKGRFGNSTRRVGEKDQVNNAEEDQPPAAALGRLGITNAGGQEKEEFSSSLPTKDEQPSLSNKKSERRMCNEEKEIYTILSSYSSQTRRTKTTRKGSKWIRDQLYYMSSLRSGSNLGRGRSKKNTFPSLSVVGSEITKIQRYLNLYGSKGPFPKCISPLHIACSTGFSPGSVAWIAYRFPEQVTLRDTCAGRTPLHCVVQSLCDQNISFEECSEMVDILCTLKPRAILKVDLNSNAPVDIVVSRLIKEERKRIEYGEEIYKISGREDMLKLSRRLRDLGVAFYRAKKAFYEKHRLNICSSTTYDNVSTIPLSGDGDCMSTADTLSTASSLCSSISSFP